MTSPTESSVPSAHKDAITIQDARALIDSFFLPSYAIQLTNEQKCARLHEYVDQKRRSHDALVAALKEAGQMVQRLANCGKFRGLIQIGSVMKSPVTWAQETVDQARAALALAGEEGK